MVNVMHTINKNQLKCGKTYTINNLTIDDLDEILTLQNISLAKLENKSFLQPLTIDEYEYILNGHGIIVGCFIESKLIAIRALLIPSINDNYLGIEAGLTGPQLHKVIYQEISFVDPLYRGNGLQQKLGQIVMEWLKQTSSQYKYICATVAPLNIPSLLDKFRQKMVITSLKQVYENKWRYVFFKDLTVTDEQSWVMIKEIPMCNYNKQIELLQNGWIGYSFTKKDEDYFVLYGKN